MPVDDDLRTRVIAFLKPKISPGDLRELTDMLLPPDGAAQDEPAPQERQTGQIMKGASDARPVRRPAGRGDSFAERYPAAARIGLVSY